MNFLLILKRIALSLAAVFLLIVVTVALLPQSVWKGLIVRAVSTTTGRTATIDGNVDVHLLTLNPRLTVEGFSLANPAWARDKNMLQVRRFDASLSLLSLLGFHWVFPRIAIDSPSLALERDSGGRANWDFTANDGARKPSPKAANSPPMHIPVIQQLSVTSGQLSAIDQIRKLKFSGQVSVHESQNGTDTLSLQGSGMLNGRPFDLQVAGPPLVGVQSSKPYRFDTTVTAADIKLVAHTEIAHPFDLAAVRSEFRVSGQDLADVYYLTGLALPNTPPYDIAGTVDREGLVFKISDLNGKLGGSDISGELKVDTTHQRPLLSARLLSKQFNVADLAAPLGTQATPAHKSKTLDASAQAKAPAEAPQATASAPTPKVGSLLLPDADLQVDRVRAMDADVTFDAASIVTAEFPLKKVQAHLTLVNGKIAIDPLSFSLPQGEFSGTVVIDARGAVPQTIIDMKLEHVDLAQFKSRTSNHAPIEGQMVGRVHLTGSGTSVHKTAADADGDITLIIPTGQMREALAELTGINLSRGLGLILTNNDRDTAIRCGVADFHAGDGALKASTLIIDTTNVMVTGSGQIDLKTEALDLALRGEPKKARLLRLRTPITVRGSLLHPKVGVQAGKLAAQAGSAAVLGTLLTPAAAVLAFVDKGLAKDADCNALITTASEGKRLSADAYDQSR
jgi:uncharacterized protein involved in outer membrane biogenesis